MSAAGSNPAPSAEEVEQAAAHAASTADFVRAADAYVRTQVPYDVAAWASVDPPTLLGTSCTLLPEGVPSAEQELFALELTDTDPGTYQDLHRRGVVAAALRQYADPGEVERFRRIIAPGGGHDELRVMLGADGQVWGTLTAYRVDRPFAAEDVQAAGRLARALARGLRRTFLRAALDTEALDRPPGQLVLDASGQVLLTSGAAEAWLDTLSADQRRGVLASLVSSVAVGRAPSVAVDGTDGLVALHGAAMKGGDGLVGVIVEQPRPAALTPVILTAYDLSPREADVVAGVLAGRTSRQLARLLGISEHTVNDHLAAVFRKVGVGSRAELAAAVHQRFYVPRVEEGRTPSPYGWFLEP